MTPESKHCDTSPSDLAAVLEFCGHMFLRLRATTQHGGGLLAPQYMDRSTVDLAVFDVADTLENLGSLGKHLRDGDAEAAGAEASRLAAEWRAALSESAAHYTDLDARRRRAFALLLSGRLTTFAAAIDALERIASRCAAASTTRTTAAQ